MASVTGHLTPKEKQAAIAMALEGGMEPKEIFRAVTANVYGSAARRALIVEWGERMGMNATESLRIAFAAGLIPSSHPPKKK